MSAEIATVPITAGLNLTSQFGFGATIPTVSQPPAPQGGMDAPLHPYHAMKEPQ